MDGVVAPGFEAVALAFERNFEELGEIGASVAVYHQGRAVVDLAAGSDPVRGRPFTHESLLRVASCSKAALATCVLMLADAGVLDVDEPVASYWPEFGQAGKREITLRLVLSHQSGLPYPDPEESLSGLDLLSGSALLHQLARQPPWWPPGTAFAYHPTTSGAILGEVVRQVTGQTLGQWFAEHVAAPLGLDFWIGLPADLDDRVAPNVWVDGADAGDGRRAAGSYAARRLAAIAKLPPMDPDPNDPASRRAYYGLEVPAAHGITNARSLARMLAALLDEVEGVRLLSPGMLAAATSPQTDGLHRATESGTADPDLRFGLGFQLADATCPAEPRVLRYPPRTATRHRRPRRRRLRLRLQRCATSAPAATHAGPLSSPRSRAASSPAPEPRKAALAE